jgi:myosin heavy subunit
LGNIEFDDSCKTDNDPCKIKNKEFLNNAAQVMSINENLLENSLLKKTIQVGNE